MPKVKDKGKKRKLSNDAVNHTGETRTNSQKLTNLEGIAKSKQLEAKVKKRDSSYSSTGEPKMCGNKIPMPSLADLEKMFEDSDDEVLNPTTQNTQCLKLPGANKEVLLSSNCSKSSENNVDTITQSEQLLDTENTDDMKVKPLVIKRKRKLDPGLNIGENKMYYIENESPTKKRKECENSSSNTCDNDLSVIIPEMSTQNADSMGSGDSNKTVEYDYHTVSPNYKSRPFSPLPSTSKNNDVFLKNDLIFNQSLMSKNDVEIIEMPCETIILDDDDDDDDVICSNVSNNIPVNSSNNEVINVPDEDDLVYSTDYMRTFDVDKADSDCEIIDIDNLIAENKAFLGNCKRKSNCFDVKPPVEIVESVDVVEATENNETFTELSNLMNAFFSEEVVEHVPYNVNTKEDQGVFEKIANLTNTLSSMFTSSLRTLTRNPPPANQQSSLDDSIVLVSAHGLHPAHQHGDQVQIISPPPASPHNAPLPNNNRPIDSCLQQNCNKRKTRQSKKEKEKPVSITDIQRNTNNVQANIPVRSLGDCPICMESLCNSTVASTICGHVFCMKCIKAAIQASGKRCPTCRKMLKGNGFHQLFL